MTLEDAVRDLYGLDPAEFVAARTALADAAKESGDRELAAAIGHLRKPTVTAWTVNLLARSAPDDLAALLRLGSALRTAQRDLSADQLRTLTVQRQQAVAALAARAGALAAEAGRRVGEPVLREIGQTLNAALADPEVARQLTEGALVTGASYEGFGIDGPALAAVPRPADSTAGPAHEAETGSSSGTKRAAGSRAHTGKSAAAVTSAADAKSTGESAGSEAAADTKASGATVRTGAAAHKGKSGTPTEAGAAGRPGHSGARAEAEAAAHTRASDSSGAPDAERRSRSGTKETARRDAARQALAEARDELETVRATADSAREAADRATAELTRADTRLADLRADLEHAEQQRRFARAAEREAREHLQRELRAVERAERRERRARADAGED